MIKVSAQQMREIDRRATKEYGIPPMVLMENAGRQTAEVAIQMLEDLRGRRVAVICGQGKNGGDGFVAARHLVNFDKEVEVYLVGRRDKVKGESLTNLNVLLRMELVVKEIADLKTLEVLKEKISGTDLIIDALLGIGLSGPVREPLSSAINFLNQTKKPILSVDVPSGLDSTTGKVLGTCIKAKKTVTFCFAKCGFFIEEGPKYVGELVVVDIGVPLTKRDWKEL